MTNAISGEELNTNYTCKASHKDQSGDYSLTDTFVTTGLENIVTSCWKTSSEDYRLLQFPQACPERIFCCTRLGDGPPALSVQCHTAACKQSCR